VILVGGMTRMPAVQSKVEELIGREPHRGINPDEAVALGAAVQASIILGDVPDVVLLDVTPLSLGIEIEGGLTEKIVPANTSIPTRTTEVFTTSADGQSSVEVRVLQGERELADDNRLLGRVQLLNIPAAPRGAPEIEVVFDLSVDGLLTVGARDISTGAAQTVRIESTTGLAEAEIERMKEEAERYAESDRQARARAEMRNEVDVLREQVESLLEAGSDKVSPATSTEVEASLEALDLSVASGGEPQQIASARERVLTALRSVVAEIGAPAGVSPKSAS
jgi:molecular chaperone DnaK